MLNDLIRFNNLKEVKYEEEINGIINQYKSRWHKLLALSGQPNSKLSATELVIKQNVKQAKRTIIHEINKKQQHLPVKSLFSQAEQTLLSLQPVWMMNPLAIAERLPLIQDLFDVVIFDESSQIPLEDAIPAAYRAKQAIVVGDSKQMPPSRFFSSKADSITLLDQAEHVYPNVMLNWHYRSKHPKLISFSNQYFYENELRLFPPLNNQSPVAFNFIEDGIFRDNINVKEAKAIAKRYLELVGQNNDIGIIAFSKAQEECIRKEIVSTKHGIVDGLIIKNLESVQGIEKDIVLVSIGYAKNYEGVLKLNFGPVNQSQGENRLNVLFTRAISRMEVFSSITSSDLALSDNNGIMTLKAFLEYVEQADQKSEYLIEDNLSQIIFKILKDENRSFTVYSENNGLIINGFVQHESGKLLLVNPGVNSREDIDLSAIISKLKQDFKSVKIILIPIG